MQNEANISEKYLENSSQKKHVPLKYLDNERKKYIHCINCSLIHSSVGAHSLKADALINPSCIKSSRCFCFSSVPGSTYFFPLKNHNKVVLLQKNTFQIWLGRMSPVVGTINLGAPFLSTHFEIRGILSSSLEMLIFFSIAFQSYIMCG